MKICELEVAHCTKVCFPSHIPSSPSPRIITEKKGGKKKDANATIDHKVDDAEATVTAVQDLGVCAA